MTAVKKIILNWRDALGLQRAKRLDKELCEQRVRRLKRGIRQGKYDGKHEGKLLNQAKYYAAWYGWLARKYDGKRPPKKTNS
jgi:hypothetical protein